MTAALNGGNLEISYNAGGDLVADISSDGTKYTVSGTGLAAVQFKVSAVTGAIVVADKAALSGQAFTVKAGTAALVNPLQVNANVESTVLNGGITPTTVGAVSVGSATIVLANDVSTAATNGTVSFSGAVALGKNVSLSAGSGDIDFKNKLNGGFALTINAAKDVFFRGAVGDQTPLAGVAIKAATSVMASDTIRLDGSTPRTGGTATPFADGLTIYGGVNKVSLTNQGSEIKNFTGSGFVFLGGSTGSTVSGFTITANGGNGVLVGSGGYTGTVIQANEVFANTGSGIRLEATGGVVSNLLVGGAPAVWLGNRIHDNAGNGITASSGDYTGTVIVGNLIRGNGDAVAHTGDGILVQGKNLMIGWTATAGTPNTVANEITGNARNGITVTGADAVNNTIMSNAIYKNGYVDTSVPGRKSIVGQGISLTDGGNAGQVAPVILRVVDSARDGVTRVSVAVRGSGDYYVQLFDNGAEDERNIYPVQRNRFEGRAYVADSPQQTGSVVAAGTKPALAGTMVKGDTVAIIEIPAGRRSVGNWLTATATAMSGTTPTSTSGFSAAAQIQDAPTLAVGGDGPTTWSQEFSYTSSNPNLVVVRTATAGSAVALAGLGGSQTKLLFTPAGAAAGGVVDRQVKSAVRTGRVVRLTLKPAAGLPLGAAGTFVIGSASLPAARLYDTSRADPAASPLLEVGAAKIAQALLSGGVTQQQANIFVNRFRGGIRVAGADVDGDGFVDLATVAGAIPANPTAVSPAAAATRASLNSFRSTATGVGDAVRVVTIFNGNQSGSWSSASLNVSRAFPGYTGGFRVTFGDLRPENAGSGNAVAELIVAGTGRVAIYDVFVGARGAAPTFSTVPALINVGRVTGIAAGDFADTAGDELVVATTKSGPSASPTVKITATSFVQTFSLAGAPTKLKEFAITSIVENGPRRAPPLPSGFAQNIFFRGASLAVGDIDGALTITAGVPQLKPELVLGGSALGLANFRVLANEFVASGDQSKINTALTNGNGYTRQSRASAGSWQPTGGPDYFVGISSLSQPNGLGINAPLSLAVVDYDGIGNVTNGTTTVRAEVFAALGATNATKNTIRRMKWNGLDAWTGAPAVPGQTGAAALQGPGSIVAPESANEDRFPEGFGLQLG